MFEAWQSWYNMKYWRNWWHKCSLIHSFWSFSKVLNKTNIFYEHFQKIKIWKMTSAKQNFVIIRNIHLIFNNSCINYFLLAISQLAKKFKAGKNPWCFLYHDWPSIALNQLDKTMPMCKLWCNGLVVYPLFWGKNPSTLCTLDKYFYSIQNDTLIWLFSELWKLLFIRLLW